ncbi:MAG: GDPmannose 4,6-dehydratase, partial [Candidatus Berkelbacteria bacterium Licking1014_85]
AKIGKKVKILLASSGMVYGDCPKPAKETDKIKPIGDYAQSKAQMEKEALKFKNTNLQIVITRAFNHTGPGQKLGFVVPDFANQIAQIEKGKLSPKMKVGDLSAKRNFLDVRDVVSAYQLIMEKSKSSLYNIATAKPYSIEQILKILLSFSKVKIDVQIDKSKLRPSDVQKSTGSIAKIKKELGWQPKIPLETTLKKTLNFWRKIN